MACDKLFFHVKCKEQTEYPLFKLKYWATERKTCRPCLTTHIKRYKKNKNEKQYQRLENTIKKIKPQILYIQIRWVTKYS
jgi:hypothetical protein